MVHVQALPGTPSYRGNFNQVIDRALSEAEVYAKSGIHALMIENMHDVPYLNREAGHEITAAMAVIGNTLKREFALPVGIQILAGANKQALAAALAGGLDFIRAEGFVFGHVADEGFIQSDAGELLRYRKYIGAEHIAVFTDIKKKHASHQLTADTGILEHAKAAAFFLSDGLVITGSETGEPVKVRELQSVKSQMNLPVFIGSGLTDENLNQYYALADGFIVGSYFKMKGMWSNPVDENKVVAFMEKFRSLSNI
jgi:membrane complex biogenesis BtpA family protein